MPTYIIEREIPGASELTDDELRGITTTSNDAVADLDAAVHLAAQLRRRRQDLLRPRGRERRGRHREHARRGGFPANLVAEVAAVFDARGPRELPV